MRLLGTTLSLLLTAGIAFSQGLSVGDIAPDFSLPYATRDSVSSDRLTLSKTISSGTVIVGFYPADWSSGCTKEVCSMRDAFAELGSLGADFLAISGDYVYSHHAWAKSLGLPFRLLSDHDHAVAKLYNSFNAASGFNRRTVFVIDRTRHIRYVDMEYSVRDDEDFNRLKAALKNLN